MPGVRSSPWRQVDDAAVRVLDDPAGQPHGHRVDGEVAAAEVALEGVAEVDGRLARGGVVGLGAVGRHLDGPRPLAAADGAEVAAHVPGRVTPLREQPLGVVGPRRGGEVEVGVRPAEHRVAHRPADQRQLVAGGREHLAEVVDHGRDPLQLEVRVALELDHGQRGGLGCGHEGQL